MKNKNLDFKTMSTAELEQALKQRKLEEKQELEKRREAYEAERDVFVRDLVEKAHHIHETMRAFKTDCIKKLEEFRQKAQEYGEIRSNSKGGFSLRTNDGRELIAYERNTKSEYDERANMAEDLLRDFLQDMVKKKDKDAYETVLGLVQRGFKGKFNPAAIAALLKMEDRFSDERWVKAMKLFKESYRTHLISMNVSFYRKNAMDKDIGIPLTFASINVEPQKSKNHEANNVQQEQ